jgi:hypothetical protein
MPYREYAHIGRRDAISPRARRRHGAPPVIEPLSILPTAPHGFSPMPPPTRGARRLRKISLACQRTSASLSLAVIWGGSTISPPPAPCRVVPLHTRVVYTRGGAILATRCVFCECVCSLQGYKTRAIWPAVYHMTLHTIAIRLMLLKLVACTSQACHCLECTKAQGNNSLLACQ